MSVLHPELVLVAEEAEQEQEAEDPPFPTILVEAVEPVEVAVELLKDLKHKTCMP